MDRCPKCGKLLCDHTPAERGQTSEQLDAQMEQNQRELEERQAPPTKDD